MNWTALHTDRLEILIVTPEIIHQVFNESSKEDQMRFFGVKEEALNHYREMHEAGMETHRISLRLFLLKLNGEVIGECGFHSWNIRHRRAELFYLLRNEEHKRQGLITEALYPIIDYGFNVMKLKRIAALTADWNHASLAVIRKFGFTFEGTMRQDYLVDDAFEDSMAFSLLAQEWKATNHKAR